MKEIRNAISVPDCPRNLFAKVVILRSINILMLFTLVSLMAFHAWAEEKVPSGTVEIDEEQFSLIIGGDVGKGTLHFKGKNYTFKKGGFKGRWCRNSQNIRSR